MTKIIVTTRALSTDEQSRLTQITHGKYDVKTVSSLDAETDFSQVEIILIDTARREQLSILAPDSLRRFSNLKLIQSTRAGVDILNFEDIPASVTICGNIGAYGDQIAEHVFGMILYLARNLGVSNLTLSRGIWEIPKSMFLKGKTILVLGTGGIGESVGRIAVSFGMRTIGMNSSARPTPHFERIISLDKLDEVLGGSDVVVVTLPLTVKTFHLIDENKLRRMKPGAILINVSRGYVIEERSLYDHMRNNLEFKVASDVWWHYPKQGEKFAQKFPFFELYSFLGTPHDSGIVPETEEIAFQSAIENIGRFARDESLKGVMNRNDYLGLKELIVRAD